jgi:hypothetical protein
VQYLADFLRRGADEHHTTHHHFHHHPVITELKLNCFSLVKPTDGGLNVLCDLLANNTTLTTLKLTHCSFCMGGEAFRLIAALHSNRSITNLVIYPEVADGNFICDVLQNMPQLQRLQLYQLTTESLRLLQASSSLRTHLHLKELNLCYSSYRDDDLSLLVDALVGNTTMDVLDLSRNYLTSNCIVDILRLAKLTRLKKIAVQGNRGLFDDNNAIRHFASALHRYSSSLEELLGLDLDRFAVIRGILFRNRSIRHAQELLALQAGTGMPIASKSGIWCMAMEKFGQQRLDQVMIDDDDDDEEGEGDSDHGPTTAVVAYPGASAVYKILQTRPTIFEKQLKRPRSSTTAPSDSNGENRPGTNGKTRKSVEDGQTRPRL